MIRLFKTHEIREQMELDGMWEFAPTDNDLEIPNIYPYTLPVPSCWEMHPDFLTYRGKAAYRKKIVLDKKTSLRMEFKGVSHTANIYFDGKHLAHHYNAYTPFSVLLPQVDQGEHEIIALVDNSFSEDSSLHIPNDYYTYGGITRPVVLEEIDDCFIERIEFTPFQSDGQWKATIRVVLNNIGNRCRNIHVLAQLEAKELDFGDIELCEGSTATIFETFTFEGVEAWNHLNPQLYLLEVALHDKDTGNVFDDLIERVGFRTTSLHGQQLQINGENIFLKGFNRHEDHALVGCSFPLQLMVKDIELVLDMGGNAIRTCHYPNDELFLDLCDERGIYVWEENHARGLSLEKMQHPLFEMQCENCITEMVHGHFNHPSIVIWGILNECASNTPEGKEMYRQQFQQIETLDSSRPLTFASCHMFKDISLELPDIVSVNLYPGWYHDDPIGEFFAKVKAWIDESEGKEKPIIISEFGAEGVYGFREPTRVKGSEERQSDILDECLSVYLNQSGITGVFVWQFSDCRVTEEGNWFLTRPKTKNNKGVVDSYRRPKIAYETIKKHYKGK